MLADVTDSLACPHCERPLSLGYRTVTCAAGHTFDVARQGYVNLLGGGAHTGTADTPGMVAARWSFLATGAFTPLAEQVAADVARGAAGVSGAILDVGAGTGYYLAHVLEALPDRSGLALDVSKHAAQYAARAHARIGVAVCDAWGRLPVRDGVAAVAMIVFAPRNATEVARVLAPGGALVVAVPTTAHLAELVERLGLVTVDAQKERRLAETLEGHFERESAEPVEMPLSLSHGQVLDLVAMGPSARHLDEDVLRSRVDALGEPVETALSAVVSVWRRHPLPPSQAPPGTGG